MTAKEIIRAALRQINAIGATEEPTAADYAACLEYMNNLNDAWSAEGLLIYAFTRSEFTLTVGQTSYSLGSGGDFAAARPAYIDSAQIQYPGDSTDHDVEIVPQNVYDGRSLKTTQGRPEILFYNPTYPTGTVYLSPTPEQAYTLRLNMLARLGTLGNINTTVSFPEEYRRALVFNLAVDIANMYGFDAPQDTKRIARESKDVLMSRNSANLLGQAEFDSMVQRSTGYGAFTKGDFISGT